jgi:putative hydrolase of the HAD superfamily
VAPEHVLHVGDIRRTDVAGARALGMQTARLRARHDDESDRPEADWVVSSHDELADLLGVRPLVEVRGR